MTALQTRTIRMAAAVLGGPLKLRARLDVSATELMHWLSGKEPPPREIFIRALEIILDDLDVHERDRPVCLVKED